jgi:hypothetical protein
MSLFWPEKVFDADRKAFVYMCSICTICRRIFTVRLEEKLSTCDMMQKVGMRSLQLQLLASLYQYSGAFGGIGFRV